MNIPTADINPKAMECALKATGWSPDELADETNIEPDVIERWMITGKSVRLTELEKIGKRLKVPITLFFAESLPEISLPKDYRRTRDRKVLSKDTLFAIRNSRYHQMLARRMLSLQNMKLGPAVSLSSRDDDPEHVASKERERVGFAERPPYDSAKTEREAYRALRDAIETANIFTMQYNMDDARGFTLPAKDPAVIVVNSADAYRPRMFTLLHEYAHILLGDSGICTPEAENVAGSVNAVEAWCNAFAGSFLMPRHASEEALEELTEDLTKPDLVINRLSKTFIASKTAIAMRIANVLDGLNSEAYLNYAKTRLASSQRKGGLASQSDKCLNRRGKRFAGMVLDLGERRLLTSADVSRYLELKPKHFGELMETIHG